jgi:hypothetical protein
MQGFSTIGRDCSWDDPADGPTSERCPVCGHDSEDVDYQYSTATHVTSEQRMCEDCAGEWLVEQLKEALDAKENE